MVVNNFTIIWLIINFLRYLQLKMSKIFTLFQIIFSLNVISCQKIFVVLRSVKKEYKNFKIVYQDGFNESC